VLRRGVLYRHNEASDFDIETYTTPLRSRLSLKADGL
jgi:hypothetical protein